MSIGFSFDPVGWVEDAAGAVSDLATSAWDVLDDIPGVAELGSGFRALVTGPLRDVAKSSAGQTVLRAVAGAAYATGAGALGPMLGAQLASAAFAIPGLAKGDGFWDAWFQESWYRAKETASILGPGALDGVSDFGAKEALSKIEKYAPDVSTSAQLAATIGVEWPIDVPTLAKKIGVTELAAARALHRMFPGDPYDPNNYDSVTQKRKTRTLSKVRVGPPPVAQQTMSTGVASALDKLFAQAAAREQAEAAAALAVAEASSAAKIETAGNVALVGVVTAGALAGAWWYFRKR